MIIIVGALLLTWFGSILIAYSLGFRSTAGWIFLRVPKVADPRVYICDYCQNPIIGSDPVDPKPTNGRDIRMHSECIEHMAYTRA